MGAQPAGRPSREPAHPIAGNPAGRSPGETMTRTEPGRATHPLRVVANRGPFVGRERELAALETMLGETAVRGGHMALVSGEPGIGKTRLVAEAATRAAAGGWLVLAGRAFESEGAPPYLPFSEILRQYIRICPTAELAAQLGRGAAEVAILAPELLERAPGIEAGPALNRDERYRLFEGVAGLLVNAAHTRQPGIMLVIDDLHWADADSLLLLQHLARRLPEAPLFVAATCRTTGADRSPALTDCVATLIRERLCVQVDPGGFSTGETGWLIRELAGAEPPERVTESLRERTGGNPFFLEEAIHDLLVKGRDLAQEKPWSGDQGIPETVRQVIASRLGRLGAETKRVLQVASALDDPFAYEALGAASETDPAVLADSLDEATAYGLVNEEGEGRYRFHHALVRETIYSGLSAPRRAALHAEIAGRLDELYGVRAADHAGEVARHYLLGGRKADLERAIGCALQAAENAMKQLAYQDAVRHYESVLDALSQSGQQDSNRRCEMLLALATATAKAGDMARTDQLSMLAAREARAAGEAELLARACLSTSVFGLLIPNEEFIPLVEDALGLTSAGDSTRRSALLSVLACQRAMTASWEEAAPVREESIAMARRLGDGQALAFALRNAYIAWPPEQLESRRTAVGEVVELARTLGDRELEVTSQCDHLQDSLLLGDIEAVDAGIEAHTRLAEELQQGMQSTHALILRSMRALLSGPLSRAEELNGEMQVVLRRHGTSWTRGALAAHTFLLRWEQGRLGELEPAYRAGHEREASLAIRVCLAFILAHTGDAAVARAIINEMDEAQIASFSDRASRTYVVAMLAQASAAVGETGLAETLGTYLVPQANHAVTVNGSPACMGSASRYLGLLASTMGRFEEANRHFDAADAFNERLGAGPLLAHTKVDRARTHLARGGHGELAHARELLREAAIAFDALEIPHHAGEARRLLATLPAGERVKPAYPAGLSEREVEVLRLLANGLTNQQIADELVISLNTVIRHVSNIFDKTGVANRAEAATFAARNGLTDS